MIVRWQWFAQPWQMADLAVWTNSFSSCRAQQTGLLQPHGIERRAVSAHQPRNGRADHLRPQLLLKGPKHGVIEERAPLHDDVLPQLLGANWRG